MNRIVITASVATIGSSIIAGLTYFELTTRTEPSTHSAQDSVESAKQPEIGRGEGMSKPEVIRERKVDSEEKSSAVIEVPVEWHEGVALGYSGEELRKANEVRGMMPLEQGQELSSLRGVYGFVHSLILMGRLGVEDDFDFPVNRLPNRISVEVHKTSGGDVMLLVYVDESSAARLGSPHGAIGSIFGFFSPCDEHSVLAGLPVRTKGCGSREASLTMVFMLARQAERHWRRLNGSEVIVHVLDGKEFKDGLMVQENAA